MNVEEPDYELIKKTIKEIPQRLLEMDTELAENLVKIKNKTMKIDGFQKLRRKIERDFSYLDETQEILREAYEMKLTDDENFLTNQNKMHEFKSILVFLMEKIDDLEAEI